MIEIIDGLKVLYDGEHVCALGRPGRLGHLRFDTLIDTVALMRLAYAQVIPWFQASHCWPPETGVCEGCSDTAESTCGVAIQG